MANSPTIKPEQWERVKEITADALECDPESRAAFVAHACRGEAEILQQVERLLSEATASEEFLATPVWNVHTVLDASNANLQDAPRFSPGQIIGGRFEIISFLNRGGMGEVYSASDRELKELVALKTIRPSIAASESVIDRFKQEVKQTRRIGHANICRVYDLFNHQQPSGETLWFLTMQLLEGVTLAERLASAGPMTIKQAIPRIKEMVAALSTAHELGIVHRDFKPNNVMLVGVGSGNERAVVTDFGLATSINLDERGPATALEGTPAYMAPERVAGAPAGFASDQYALGLVICEMLTGSKPELNRSNAVEFRKQLQAWLAAQSKRVSPRAQRVMARCLEFRPENRFRDVRDIVPVLDGSQTRLRAAWALAAAIGIVAIIGTVTAIARQDWADRVTDAVRLTSDTDLAGFPSLSRDAKWIAYMSDRAQAGNLDVWIQAFPNGTPKRLTTDPAEDTEPRISPDGKFVAFRSERNGGGVYIVGADGTGERLLAPGGRSPAFSPDGKSIAYWLGNQDDSAPSAQLYEMPVAGGRPRRIAADFADARYPTWNSNGQSLLFEGCREVAPLTTCADWWTIHSDGTAPANLGVLALLRSEGIQRLAPPFRAWRGEQMLLSGRRGALVSLWELKISGKPARVTGRPRRVTTDDDLEVEPYVTESGTIVYGRGSVSRHIWRIPAQPYDPGSSAIRVTDDPVMDSFPSASRDGRKLFFTRSIGQFGQLLMKDLASVRESVLFASESDKLWPVSDTTGDSVAFEFRSKGESFIGLIGPDRRLRALCRGCSHPTGWFANDKAVLHTTAKGEIALLDANTGRSRILVAGEPGIALGEADWNPQNEYLLFTASRNGAAKQVFGVHLRPNGNIPAGSWIPITSDSGGVDRPRWSEDGTTVFYLSRRDGSYCIWGQRFNAAQTAAPEPPFPVMHYHNQRLSPRRTSPSSLSLSVSGQSIFINVGEIRVALWEGLLKPPPPLSFFQRF